MHAIQLLHKLFKKACPQVHESRLNCLLSSVRSLLAGRRLTLTSLGRSTRGELQVKNKIKKIDRLLGNEHLHDEMLSYYTAIAQRIIGNKLHPIIIVDWASVDNRNKFQVLKASIAYEGRAITIYDQVEYTDRPPKEFNNSHDQFIKNLSQVLPTGCRPIIVADAAFSVKWFKRIEAKGWYWVGRLRGTVKMQNLRDTVWHTCQSMFAKATKNPLALGAYLLSKQALNCKIYIYQGQPKGRKRRNKDGSIKKCGAKADYSKAAREPWLLASNLPESFTIAKKVVEIYKKRMQIEETFRDIKDPRYGFGLRATLSNCKKRVAVLLLIAALALLVFGMLGKAGYDIGLHKSFQANTIKDRRVLSFWYLGQQIYEHTSARISEKILKKAFASMLEGTHYYEIG